jgi:hypothetical protein
LCSLFATGFYRKGRKGAALHAKDAKYRGCVPLLPTTHYILLIKYYLSKYSYFYSVFSEEDFLIRFKDHSLADLIAIIDNEQDYQPVAVDAAKKLLAGKKPSTRKSRTQELKCPQGNSTKKAAAVSPACLKRK